MDKREKEKSTTHIQKQMNTKQEEKKRENWKENEGRKKKITHEKDKIKFEPKNQFNVMIFGTPLNPYKIPT